MVLLTLFLEQFQCYLHHSKLEIIILNSYKHLKLIELIHPEHIILHTLLYHVTLYIEHDKGSGINLVFSCLEAYIEQRDN